jgi:hypothetical protein
MSINRFSPPTAGRWAVQSAYFQLVVVDFNGCRRQFARVKGQLALGGEMNVNKLAVGLLRNTLRKWDAMIDKCSGALGCATCL